MGKPVYSPSLRPPHSFQRRVFVLFILGSCLLLSIALPPRAAFSSTPSTDTRYNKTSTRVAPGVRLLRIYDPHGPNRIKVLRIRPQRRVTLDVALANDRLPGRETTSSMA